MSPVTTLAPETETVVGIDDETGLPVDMDVETLAPLSYDEVVDRGIEAGIWTEADGLARAIGHAAGVVPDDLLPGAETIVNGSITDVLDRANELAASGELTDDESENLRLFYEAAMPPEDVRDGLVAAVPGGAVQGFRTPAAAESCVPIDPANFTRSAWIEGCYRADVYDVQGHTVRILYPSWFDSDETLTGWPLFAYEVVRQSFEAYAPLGTLGDMDIAFSATDTSSGTLGIAVADNQWQQATISGPCPIVIFPNGQATGNRFRQTLAHEIWHCVQHFSAGMQSFSTNRWFLEGSAEYFSNVVYPSDDEEHDWLGAFDRRSRTQSLYQMDYHTWIWWQFLANQTSPSAVADLTWSMVAAGDGGEALMAERASEFQTFVVDYVAGKIPDQSGANLRAAFFFIQPTVQISKSDVGQTKPFATEPMVASRYLIRYAEQIRYLQSDQSTGDGENAMAEFDSRSDPAAWKQIHPEIRTTCKDPGWYAFVVTSGADSYEAKVQIDTTEQAVCDPCLLGAWSMQLETFESMLMAAITAEGGMPSGVTFDIVGGQYLISFDGEGAFLEKREGLTVQATASGQAISFTIDSFAEGGYQADGENISASDITESSVDVSMGGSSIFSSAGDTSSGAGTYTCQRDDLVITIQGFDPVAFDRVDRILVPSDTIPG